MSRRIAGVAYRRWQGRQDSNLQPLVLETSALPIELHPSERAAYFVSRCSWCCRQRGQNLLSSIRPGSFRLFLRVLYVRSLHLVHASAITGRFSAFATSIDPRYRHPNSASPKKDGETGGRVDSTATDARMSTNSRHAGGTFKDTVGCRL